jgi:hypothetical protein
MKHHESHHVETHKVSPAWANPVLLGDTYTEDRHGHAGHTAAADAAAPPAAAAAAEPPRATSAATSGVAAASEAPDSVWCVFILKCIGVEWWGSVIMLSWFDLCVYRV